MSRRQKPSRRARRLAWAKESAASDALTAVMSLHGDPDDPDWGIEDLDDPEWNNGSGDNGSGDEESGLEAELGLSGPGAR